MTHFLEKIALDKQWSWLFKAVMTLIVMPTIIIRAIILDLMSQFSNSSR